MTAASAIKQDARHFRRPPDRGAGPERRHPPRQRRWRRARSSPPASICGWAGAPGGCAPAFCPARAASARRSPATPCTRSTSARARCWRPIASMSPADGKPGAAARHRRQRQSEKLDRPHRRLHPRHRRPRPRLRHHRGRLSRPALCGNLAAHLSRFWRAAARACRRSASAAAMRGWTTRPTPNCTRAKGWFDRQSRPFPAAWRWRSIFPASAAAWSAIAPSATPA